ncbi:hypothetical protein EDD18DRAFT_1105041 [Armillaria luteobubalina]|uniref:Uncharacterized protein n=1 Tax=Armillaria luteobubalina TaxID=153913 RepID=A0AA39Q612_9AGAR|nr:hypothetical protein EDD18DRAFT_1105041 [Armillaria luteobubalina]
MASETDGIIATAAATLEHTKLNAPGKFERKLNSSIDKYSDATSQPFANAVNTTISLGVDSFVSQLSGWSAASSALIGTLDELQKIHPFISGNMLFYERSFQVALSLELKQRQNDEKIITLHFLMKEMMNSLLILKGVSATDGENMKAYLAEILQNIARDITECANASGRILRSGSYESNLAAYGDKFERHKLDLLLRLNTRVNVKLNDNQELMGLIDKEGGASKVMQDPALLQKIIDASEKNNKNRSARQSDSDKKIISVVQSEIRQDLQELIKTNEALFNRKFEAQKKSLVDALGETVERMGDRVISAVISGPYERLINQDLYDIWKEMHWRGSAKVRDLVLALRDYYYSGNQSVLARPMREIASPASTTESDSEASHISEAIVQPADDQWALPYINLLRIQPLMEAFDDDVSGFVTINEANALCAGRPEDWSLLHWMAYWAIVVNAGIMKYLRQLEIVCYFRIPGNTSHSRPHIGIGSKWKDSSGVLRVHAPIVGFQMTLFQYYMQIWTLLQQMHTTAEQTLPANRVFVDAFLGAYPFKRLDRLLSGLQEQIPHNGTWNWNDWSKFLPYVQGEEKKLKDQLEAFQYNIDAPDTLLLITGPGRLERAKRQYLIVKYSHSNTIYPGIFQSGLQSVDVIMDAVEVRIKDLRAVFKHKNLDEAVMLRKSVYGLFSSWSSAHSPYYWLHAHAPLELISELPLEIDQTSIDFINLKPALLPYTMSDDGMVGQHSTNVMPSKLPALLDRNKEIYELEGFDAVIGTWVGTYRRKGLGTSEIAVFCINDAQADGTFAGFGTDTIGEFIVQGKLSLQASDSTRVIFHKARGKDLAVDKWRYEGTISSSTMEGRWDSESDQEGTDNFETTRWTTQDAIIGEFSFEHSAIECYLKGFWPYDHEYQDLVFQYGLSRASSRVRWAYAIRVVLHRIRRSCQEMRWSHLKERRARRQKFIDLIIQRDCRAGWLPYTFGGPVDWGMMDTLTLFERTLYPQDILALYRSLAWFKARRQIVQAQAQLEKAQERFKDPSRFPQCAKCKGGVTLPCWFCVDCEDEFFLCFECNAKYNATEPWTTEKYLCPEEGHTYVHKLVLCPEPKPDGPKALSVEERLAATEKHMEEMGKHMETTKKHIETHIQTTGKHMEETKKRMEASQLSLQELFELQKENNDAIQKKMEKMLTWGAGLIVLIFAIWAMMMRG